jgi:two-component system cell cycle response regulator DivK
MKEELTMKAPNKNRDEQIKRKRATTGNPTTVLVVEDFDETRSMLHLLLEMSGYRVAEATNGQQAMEVAREEHPDLILMDLNLPVLDGFAATRLIREDAELRQVPIVAITADDTAEYRDMAFTAGCDEYVTKPIDYGRLERMLREFLDS